MDPLDYLDRLLGGVPERSVPCPDCCGKGWEVYQANAWWPPEQVPCERCDTTGSIPEHELTEREGLMYEPEVTAAECWPDEGSASNSDEEQDDPDGLLDDDDEPTDASDDGPPSLGVSQ